MQKESMIKTMSSLKGNARACIWTEPLWGIPYNLCAAYATPYMRAFGLSTLDIGLIGSLYLMISVVASVLSGVLTDKLGRKRCTFIFDLICWSIPELLWAFAQNRGWFFAAVTFNGLMRITGNSWGLLLVEDAEDEMVLKFNSLAQLMGLITVFIAPLSGLAVNSFGIIPTMRVIYLMGFVLMTTKFFVLNFMVRETSVGVQRMKETANESLMQLLLSCKQVYVHLLREKRILLTMALIAVFQVVSRLNEYFWGPYVIESIGVADGNLVLFTSLKSLVTLGCIMLIMPRIKLSEFKRPTLLAWGMFMVAQALLVLAPGGGLGTIMLIASAICEGVTLSILSPVIDTMLVINADPTRRARIYGLVYGTILIPVSFFPTLAGWLAGYVAQAPFLINLCMLALGMALTVLLSRSRREANINAIEA